MADRCPSCGAVELQSGYAALTKCLSCGVSYDASGTTVGTEEGGMTTTEGIHMETTPEDLDPEEVVPTEEPAPVEEPVEEPEV